MSDKHDNSDSHDAKRYWLDDPKNVDKIWYGLIGACILLFAADFFVEKHPYFSIEKIPNFWGLYGFVGCVFLVLSAAQLRRVLMREEDYYEKQDAEYEARRRSVTTQSVHDDLHDNEGVR